MNIAVGGSAAALAAALGVPAVRFMEPEPHASVGAAPVGKVEEFPPGAVRMVLFNERPVLVIRDDAGELRAFSAICTHLRCVVGYSPERRRIECPCHRGVFSLDGQNVSGPPPRPLDELSVTVDGGTVVLSAT